MLPEQLLTTLARHYGLSTLSVHEKVTRGFSTTNHIVESGNLRLFLKHWRSTAFDEVAEVGRIERHFASCGIPVIVALPTENGDYCVEVDGNIYSLYPFVAGIHREQADLAGDPLRSFAHQLARIHTVAQPDFVVNDHYKPWDHETFTTTVTNIRNAISENPEGSEFERLVIDSLNQKEKLLTDEHLQIEDVGLPPYRLCHGDYTVNNVFFDETGQVSSVFDLEKTEIGPHTVELLRSVVISFLNEGFDNDEGIKRAARCIGYYSEIVPLVREDIEKALTTLRIKWLYSVWIEKDHYLKRGNRVDVLLPGEYKRDAYLAHSFYELVTQLSTYL